MNKPMGGGHSPKMIIVYNRISTTEHFISSRSVAYVRGNRRPLISRRRRRQVNLCSHYQQGQSWGHQDPLHPSRLHHSFLVMH